EKLIHANQDFSKLKSRDMDDKIVPPWLKVYWRKGHPEANYDNPNDPTGGYPLVLKEVLEWMMTHQDFQPGFSEASMEEGTSFGDHDADEEERMGVPGWWRLQSNGGTPGTNVRTSGAQTASRSESDIRINYWNTQKIIAASNNIGGSGTQGMYYSSDAGVTWGQTNLPLASGDSFHSDPTVDWSSDGTAWSTTNGSGSYAAPVKLVTTYDSYDIGVPAFNSRRILLYVSGGAYRNGTTNNVYALWTDLSGATGCTTSTNEPGSSVSSTCKTRIWFARSTDGGATWSARVKINDQSGLNDQFNPFLAVDETNGTIGAIYYDTVADAGRKKVDIYYQMSSDG